MSRMDMYERGAPGLSRNSLNGTAIVSDGSVRPTVTLPSSSRSNGVSNVASSPSALSALRIRTSSSSSVSSGSSSWARLASATK